MPLYYQIKKKRNPQGLDKPVKYYVMDKTVGHITQKDLVADMVTHVGLTRPEALAAIEYLFESLPKFIEMGFTVQLGDMGYFRAYMQSDGADTPEEANANLIRNIRLKFICGKQLRDRIKNCRVEKFEKK